MVRERANGNVGKRTEERFMYVSRGYVDPDTIFPAQPQTYIL
jgi:hypothetical protein